VIEILIGMCVLLVALTFIVGLFYVGQLLLMMPDEYRAFVLLGVLILSLAYFIGALVRQEFQF
jgi:hypothetical protein